MADYKKTLNEALARLEAITKLQNELDVETVKLKQFINATMNMLSDQERAEFEVQVREQFKEHSERTAGLVQTIRKILREAGNQWLTAAQVKHHLIKMGFDFSSYESNPLASVSTTLRRFKSGEVETANIEGTAAYRWRANLSKRRKVSGDKAAKLSRLDDMKKEVLKTV